MKIVTEGKIINVYYDGSDLDDGMKDIKVSQWPFSVYNKLKKEIYAEAFRETNMWLMSLDETSRKRIARMYENCQAIITKNINVKQLISEVQNEVKNIQDILDYRNVYEWNAKEKAFPHIELRQVFLLNAQDLAITTYSDDEAHKLTCMGVSIKLLTPLWGTLADMVKAETSNTWKERKVLEIVKGTDIEKCPVYQKLQGFCYAKADSARNKISPAAQRGVTPQKLKEGTMAAAMVRFLSVYTITSPKDIVRSLFQDVKTYIDTSSITVLRDKAEASGSTTSDDDGVAQHYRRPGETRPSDRAMAQEYIKSPSFRKAIGINDVKTMTEYRATLDGILKDPNSLTELHLVIMAMAFIVDGKQVFSVRLLSTIKDKLSVRHAQVAAYYRMLKLGHEGIAGFIISKYSEVDPSDMTSLVSIIVRGLDQEQHAELEACYPLVNSNVSARNRHTETPGYKLIEKLVSFIIKHKFEQTVDFSNVRLEMLTLLLNMNKQ